MSTPLSCCSPSQANATGLPSGENDPFENSFENEVSGTSRMGARSERFPPREGRNQAANARARAKPTAPAAQSLQEWAAEVAAATGARGPSLELRLEFCRSRSRPETSGPERAVSDPLRSGAMKRYPRRGSVSM